MIYCSSTHTVEREYTPQGSLSYEREAVNDDLRSELRRVFLNTKLEGIGIFENDNEGLARRMAIKLAIEELAGKIQTRVRSESVIYNNKDARDVVETQINALVQNYEIESAGYDLPDSIIYRVRISIKGERLIREIERMIR